MQTLKKAIRGGLQEGGGESQKERKSGKDAKHMEESPRQP